ncbi:MAG TPA: glycosyltransferase family 9 protein, partial [Chloroflexota bacterium]|nr:glycosyltransferase family 9 protein [Chloroflexota bacterium]
VPHRQLYQEVPCRLCYARVCPHDHACLRGVTPAMVVAAVADLLAEVGARPGERRQRTRLLAEAGR